MQIDVLKQALRIDGDEADVVLSGYVLAAETYLINAGCKKDESNELYNLLITMLVGRFYDSPTLLTSGVAEGAGITLNGLIAQLRLSQSVTAPTDEGSDSNDTGGETEKTGNTSETAEN